MKEEIEGVLYQAIEFLSGEPEALSNMVKTFILQLLATLVLFLAVRFKFWNIITNIIEGRQKQVEETLKERDEALLVRDAALKEAEELKTETKKNAAIIMEEARKNSMIEAENIIKDAHEKIEIDQENARRQIEKERNDMHEEIKNEIVDVAFQMAEKMVEHEIDKGEHKKIIDDTLSALDNK